MTPNRTTVLARKPSVYVLRRKSIDLHKLSLVLMGEMVKDIDHKKSKENPLLPKVKDARIVGWRNP